MILKELAGKGRETEKKRRKRLWEGDVNREMATTVEAANIDKEIFSHNPLRAKLSLSGRPRKPARSDCVKEKRTDLV